MHIEIDENSGFCFGVKRAIELAEQSINKGEKVYCLGEIVHNTEEVKRLEAKGMITINQTDLQNLQDAKVLFRAHGEAPSTYNKIAQGKNNLTDGTCPIVLGIQKKVLNAWLESSKINGQVVIFGKRNHAEVLGLAGQTNNEAFIVSSLADLDSIDFLRPVTLFAQTTMDAGDYAVIASEIEKRMLENAKSTDIPFIKHNTICGHVSGRAEKLKNFAQKFDTIVFVSGKNSSNGKVLYEVCLQNNPNTHWATDADSIQQEWFNASEKVGICGATSTPRWLMEQIADKIKEIKK